MYFEGRELAENLRRSEARGFYEEAVALDPDLAMGHVGLAFSAPTMSEFYAHMNAAANLEDTVSEGEKLLLQGLMGMVKGDPATQYEAYSKLVELYPQDERAHNWLAGYYYGRQELVEAIKQYRKATDINPEFSPAYSMPRFWFWPSYMSPLFV